MFYPNVTTLRSGFWYRKSVCRLSETSMHFTQGVEAFGNISWPLCTLAILWPPCKILRRSCQGNLPSEALNARGVTKYSDRGLTKAISH